MNVGWVVSVCAAYAVGMLASWRCLRGALLRWHVVWWCAALVACALHAMMLHRWIDVLGQQNLSAVNLLSLWCWTMTAIAIGLRGFRYGLLLCLFEFPLSIISVVMVAVLPGQWWFQTASDWAIFWHVILSVAVMSVLGVTALMASLMRWREMRIRRHSLADNDGQLPALSLIERHLFIMLTVAFVLLTVILVTAFMVVPPDLWFSQGWALKGLLALIIWGAMLLLLWGRWCLGWRGRWVTRSVWLMAGALLFIYTGLR